MCVARDERVRRPVHQPRTEQQHAFALVLLEALGQSGAARVGPHGEHVGPVHQRAIAKARHAEDKAGHSPLIVKCPCRHAADFLRNTEDRDWHTLGESTTPGVVLKGNAGVVVG